MNFQNAGIDYGLSARWSTPIMGARFEGDVHSSPPGLTTGLAKCHDLSVLKPSGLSVSHADNKSVFDHYRPHRWVGTSIAHS
jgi:hypothetical protein